MINMDKILEIIEIILWTGWIKDEKPTSGLLIAGPESAKTKSLEKYRYNKGIVYISDVTMYGLVQRIQNLKANNEAVNHIVIPDFLNPLSRAQSVTRSVLQFLNSLIEEGVGLIKTGSISFEIEAQCGLLTAITQQKFKQKRMLWTDIGFMSRLVPITYSYSIDTLGKIFEYVSEGGHTKENPINLDFPIEKVDVDLQPELARRMIPYATLLAKPQKMYGIRLAINFNTMLKAIALKDNRKKVNKTDVEKLQSLCTYINYDFKNL